MEMSQTTTPLGVAQAPSVNIPPKRKNWKVVSIAVLLILGGLGLFFYFLSKPASNKAVTVPVEKLAQVEEGKLVPGFPRELIIQKDAVIVSSNSFQGVVPDKGQGFIVKTATYSTASGRLDSMYNAYINLIQGKGYKILKAELKDDGSRELRFKRTTDNVLIGLKPLSPSGTEVSINVTEVKK